MPDESSSPSVGITWAFLGKCREILAKCREADIANLAKSHQISIAWMASPYSSEQGRSRETMLLSRVLNLPAA
jgi:hypothetical protein